MSFNSNAPRAEYDATAGQTVFPFVFKIYADSDLVAYKTVGSADPLLLQLTTDFTVTINGDAGGELTLNSGADEDDVITILRDLPITRETEYQTSGDMRAETLNIDQEYQTYLIADQKDQVAALEAGDAGVSSFVHRAGDAMTGHLIVPSGATGTQVPQAQEVLSSLVVDTTPQLGGDLDFNGKTANKSAVRQIDDASLGTGTYTFDYDNGDMVQLTATGDITLAVSNFPSGDVAGHIVDCVNFGTHTITHPVAWLFAKGIAPAYTASGTDRILLMSDKDGIITLTVIAQDIGTA